MAQQMHDAGLHLGLREHGVDRIRKTVQPVNHGDQHVLHPAGDVQVWTLSRLSRQFRAILVQANSDLEADPSRQR